MTIHSLFLFTTTVFVASIIPGPSMMLALTHGVRYGARRTVASAMGNVSVTIIQALISIAGLGTILITSELIFHLIKWAGAGYLVYLGISLLFASNKTLTPIGTSNCAGRSSLKKLFMQAAMVTAGNPKAIVFFTAVFPQFIDPSAAFISQSLILVSICITSAFCCYMIYAIGGQKIASLFSRAVVGKYIKRVIGTSFIGAGIGLAVSD